MSVDLSIADYVVICIMLTISAGIGLYFRFTGGRQKTTQEFLMADKNMGALPVTFSLMATAMSAVLVLGTPAESYFYGAGTIIIGISFSIGIIIATYCFVPVYFDTGSNTVYDYLMKRFGKRIKIAASFLFFLQMILYMPVVVYAPSLALNTVTGLSLWTCVIIMAVVCTFYSTLGGLKAVLWTDFFQAILMIFTVSLLIVKVCLEFGGISKVFQTAKNGSRLDMFNTAIDPNVRYTLWNSIPYGALLGIFYYGANFSLIQRLTSCGTFKTAKRSLLWNVPLHVSFKTGACILGIVLYSYYHDCDPVSDKTIRVTSGDQIVPYFMLTHFNNMPGLSGLCIAGILSAALSTMSSIQNSLAALTIEDYIKVYGKCKHFSDSKSTTLAKLLAIFYGGLCVILAFVLANVKGVFEVAAILVGMVAGPTVGIFLLGMFTLTANEMGTLIGLIAGFVINAWMGFGSTFNGSKYPPLPLSTAGCPTEVNSSILETLHRANFTVGLENASVTNSLDLSTSGEKYIFPLYKLSFLWITSLGFVSTLLIGYLASLIVGFYMERKHVDPLQLSPVVRKWLCSAPMTETILECTKLPNKDVSGIGKFNK